MFGNIDEATIVLMFEQGGVFMYLILATSMVALTIALERTFSYFLVFQLNAKDFFKNLKTLLESKQWEKAKDHCQSSFSPLAKVIGAGLQYAPSPDKMDLAMETEALYHAPRIQSRLGHLATLFSVATLLGLLGTISGLILSFSGLSEEAQGAREEVLATGISTAMYTTGFGLFVAVIIIVMHSLLSSKAQSLLEEFDHYTRALKQIFQNADTSTLARVVETQSNSTDRQATIAETTKKHAVDTSAETAVNNKPIDPKAETQLSQSMIYNIAEELQSNPAESPDHRKSLEVDASTQTRPADTCLEQETEEEPDDSDDFAEGLSEQTQEIDLNTKLEVENYETNKSFKAR